MAEQPAPVSVVIAAYNAERTLGPALASVLAQLPRRPRSSSSTTARRTARPRWPRPLPGSS